MEYQIDLFQGRALLRFTGTLDATLETDDSWRALGRAIVGTPVDADRPLYLDFRSVDRVTYRALHDLRRLLDATGRGGSVVFVGPGTGVARLAELGGAAELPEFIAAPPWESGQDPRTVEEILDRALPEGNEEEIPDRPPVTAADLENFTATPVDTRASTKIEEFVIDLDLERLYLEHQSDSRETGRKESDPTLFFGSNWKPIRSPEPKAPAEDENTTLWGAPGASEVSSASGEAAVEERAPVLVGSSVAEGEASIEATVSPTPTEPMPREPMPSEPVVENHGVEIFESSAGRSAQEPPPAWSPDTEEVPSERVVQDARSMERTLADPPRRDAPESRRDEDGTEPRSHDGRVSDEPIARPRRTESFEEAPSASHPQGGPDRSRPAGLTLHLSELRDEWDLLQHRFDRTEPTLRRLMATVRGLADRREEITGSLGPLITEEREGPRGDRWCATLVALATWSAEELSPNAVATHLRTLILTSCAEQRRWRPRLGWCHAELEADALALERSLFPQSEASAIDGVVELWRGAVATTASPRLSGTRWQESLGEASRYLDGQPSGRNGLARIVRALGYPLPGTWVELSNGECGVVLPRTAKDPATPVHVFFRHGQATAPRRFPDEGDVGVTILGAIEAPSLVRGG